MDCSYQIITDATCDLPADLVEKLHLAIIPMPFVMDGREYRQYPDNREYPAHTFYDALRAGKWVTTSQITAADFADAFRPYLEAGKDVLYIGFSSGLSGTWQRACEAMNILRKEYPQRCIEGVDSLTATLGEGLLVYLACCKQQQEDLNLHELKAWTELYRMCVSGWFLVDDLNHLKRGGRVSTAAALVGSMLGIKPILQINREGKLIVREKARGRRNAIQNLLGKMETRFTKDTSLQTVFIVHADCPADAKAVEKAVHDRFKPSHIYVNTLGPVIGAHTGPDAMAIFYIAKDRE
ncbi:MAG: DegV family protein [Oscillospiraceae bacterium]|jgi:DegV family protein with EDD domain|nr:DegV family protein [Oscillospiraceae bacterium]MDD3261883.1 DegV family protein [Oscillospiraceae bacterium]